MSDLWHRRSPDLASRLGFSCADGWGPVEFRNPLHLQNWTLPVLEVTVITGASAGPGVRDRAAARHNDPTNLVLWLGAIAYLLIIEPPLYFPAAFGISGHVDTMFAHNVFTVDFLWGRLAALHRGHLPDDGHGRLRIVRMLGVFRRYGVLVGAVCVGFVHHRFYEIFDHLGPQLRWWEWTLDNPMNRPFFDLVPYPVSWPSPRCGRCRWRCASDSSSASMSTTENFSGTQLVWAHRGYRNFGVDRHCVCRCPPRSVVYFLGGARAAVHIPVCSLWSLLSQSRAIHQWRRLRRDDRAERYSIRCSYCATPRPTLR